MHLKLILAVTVVGLCFCTGEARAQKVIEAEFTFIEDLNDDGVWDMLFIDVDGDGKIDEHLYHPNGFEFYSIWRGGVVDPIKSVREKTPSVDSRVLEQWMNPNRSFTDLISGFVQYMQKKTPIGPIPPPVK